MNKKIIEIVALCFVTTVAIFFVMYYFFIVPLLSKNQVEQKEAVTSSVTVSSTPQTATTTQNTIPETTATGTIKTTTSTPQLSMTDYLHAVPEKYLPTFMQGIAGAKRDAYIKINDEANYFLSLSPAMAGIHQGGGSSFTDIALFLGKENHDVLAINSKICVTIGCVDDDLIFLTFENGKWTGATKALLPKIDEAYIEQQKIEVMLKETKIEDFDEDPSSLPNVVYRLPRVGTGIFLEEEKSGTKLYEITWNGKQFSAKKLLPTSQIALTEQNIVGLWQANRGYNNMGQSYTDRYHFFADGSYSYVTDETSCKRVLVQDDGHYRLQNGKLYLRRWLTLALNYYEKIKDPQCPGGERWDPDSVGMFGSGDNPPEDLLEITTFSNPNYIRLKKTGFWKLSNDPYEDSPVPIGSNVKADDYE